MSKSTPKSNSFKMKKGKVDVLVDNHSVGAATSLQNGSVSSDQLLTLHFLPLLDLSTDLVSRLLHNDRLLWTFSDRFGYELATSNVGSFVKKTATAADSSSLLLEFARHCLLDRRSTHPIGEQPPGLLHAFASHLHGDLAPLHNARVSASTNSQRVSHILQLHSLLLALLLAQDQLSTTTVSILALLIVVATAWSSIEVVSALLEDSRIVAIIIKLPSRTTHVSIHSVSATAASAASRSVLDVLGAVEDTAVLITTASSTALDRPVGVEAVSAASLATESPLAAVASSLAAASAATIHLDYVVKRHG